MVFFLLLIALGMYFLTTGILQTGHFKTVEIMSSFAYLVATIFTFIFIIGAGGGFIRWIQPMNIFEREHVIDNIRANEIEALDELIFATGSLPTDKSNRQEILAKFNTAQDSDSNSDCGVCYEELKGKLLKCPECHKSAHKSCLKKWIESGQDVCIYCRHDFS